MKNKVKWKLTTFVGTRPELIRLSEIIRLADVVFEHRLIHSGQNSAGYLNEVFFADLNIRKPDISFNCDTDSLGKFMSDLVLKTEYELTLNRPDAILILGDTNTAYVSIIARRMKIPVYHLEAGNRSYDNNVPEEINRKIVDHAADFNLAYTEFARRNLLAEGIHPRTISVVGSPLREVIQKHKTGIESSPILNSLGVEPDQYFLVSMHRQENVNTKHRLQEFVLALEEVHSHYSLPLILSLHPRTKSMFDEFKVKLSQGLKPITPLGFFDYIALQANAKAVISDSGSISEEAAILKIPAITIRNSMERPEALEAGSVILAGSTSKSILLSLDGLFALGSTESAPLDYELTDTSRRTVAFILSTISNHSTWFGLHQ
jgi:UDP-N-acetylglucosamine 2-epimerase (non-hydrolysing)